MREPRVVFEKVLQEKMQRLRDKAKIKEEEKKKRKNSTAKEKFAKFYEMSYNELRLEAKKINISTWRKTKEELIEQLIKEHKKIH